MRARFVLLPDVLSLCLALGVAACSKAPEQRTFTLQGQVQSLDAPRKLVTVKHEEIKGFMPAMTMPYEVLDVKALDGLAPGDLINAKLIVVSNGAHLADIRRVGAAPLEKPPADVPNPTASSGFELLRPGDAAPDGKFLDQDGKPRRFGQFKGAPVVMTFIYTRCPLPDVCPRLSANFARVQNRFREKLGNELILLSITIDPQYDTSQVLLGNAKVWNARPDGWRFLTGPDHLIEVVARRFGMNYWPEEGLITHTSQTAVIGRDGRLAAQVDGSSFTPAQLGDLIEKELEKTNAP